MSSGKFGLVGRSLGHSWSPQIHHALADYEYDLYEVEPERLASFLQNTDLDGMNVTIPYKKQVLAYCANQSDAVRRIGSANTLLRTKKGWYADNTDYAGFQFLVRNLGVDLKGKKTLVFGSGGASLAVTAALEEEGAWPLVNISRTGENHYGNLDKHQDARILVNTTPLGMFPAAGEKPVSVERFPSCEAVLDIVYNPQRTALVMEAERLGIAVTGGLGMLVAQAARSAELFAGSSVSDEKVQQILASLSRQMSNVVLIGMPGCGKTLVGKALAEEMGRPFVDADEQLEQVSRQTIPAMIDQIGEEQFRVQETKILAELGQRSGIVLATGGGCVTRAENYPLLHQNGVIIWLQRDLDRLPLEGRPLSQKNSVQQLYEQRKDQYRAFADRIVDNNGSLSESLAQVKGAWM